MMRTLIVLTLGLLGYATVSAAREVDMRDYLLLRDGMSEAEVLYRIGPYDYESVYADYHRFPLRKVWSYIPPRGGWLTQITFDSSGHIWKLERTKP